MTVARTQFFFLSSRVLESTREGKCNFHDYIDTLICTLICHEEESIIMEIVLLLDL